MDSRIEYYTNLNLLAFSPGRSEFNQYGRQAHTKTHWHTAREDGVLGIVAASSRRSTTTW
jgi:hypothetical protein